LPSLDGHRVVLTNGSPTHGLDGNPSPDVEVHSLRAMLASEPQRLEPHLGRIAPMDHGLSAQNAANFEDGLVVVARPRARGRLHVVHVASPGTGPTLSTPRVLVLAERESELCIVESHVSLAGEAHLENSVIEIAIGENASVEHVRVHHGAPHASAYGSISARQGASSRFASRVFTFGGALARLDLNVLFDGAGAECTLDGLYLAHDGELVDHHTNIDHLRARCRSRERYKGIVDGTGLAVFDGTVFVRPGANGTEAHQENRNLLLSSDAVVHAKPHLEIDTDDVKCSHGATVGRLDPAQLFYLRSRGMDAAVARALLTYAFAREMVAPIADGALRASLEDAIARRLPGGESVRELA
jgi:Fe-S cluster assembly protein SufD